MTAEIAVLNKSAIALAADSAVTVEQFYKGEIKEKVYNSANKLFTLSKFNPVGVMIYNTMTLGGVPWETLIKVFRKEIGDYCCGNIEDYANKLFAFMDENEKIFPREQEDQLVLFTIFRKLYSLCPRDLSNSEAKNRIDQEIERLEALEPVPGFDDSFVNGICKYYESTIDRASDIALRNAQRRNNLNRIKKLSELLLSRKERLSGYSGVVVSGFGDDQMFPSLFEYNVDLVVCGRVRRWKMNEFHVSERNESFVLPFADKEVIRTIIDGVNPKYDENLAKEAIRIITRFPKEIISQIKEINEKKKSEYIKEAEAASVTSFISFIKEMEKFRELEHRAPIENTIKILPISELATVAETFLNISQIYKRMSPEIETVGGPVDVAVISKGDGFVWIKRKHYFDPKFNPTFIERYFH